MRYKNEGDSSQMRTAESLALASALLFRLSGSGGSPTLLIKGASLAHHGLRPQHASSDSDFLVEPDALLAVTHSMEKIGWNPRPETKSGARFTRHSRSFTCEGWPTDLDIHSEFPGLLSGPNSAFQSLWSHREMMMVAGHRVAVPDKASSIVIWALHSLRGTESQARHADELRQIREVVLPKLSESERQELADRIVELGADEPLRAVPEFAEIIGDRHGPQAPGALEAWQAKMAQAHEVTPWLQVLRDARPGDRPRMVVRAIWPSAHDLRLMDEVLVDTPLGRVQSRGRRAWRLVQRIVERRRQAH